MQLKWTAVALAAMMVAACGKKEEPAPAPAPAPAAAAPAAAPAAETITVKIGHVAPTSGAIAHLGKDNELGARMAIEELNAANVKIGDKVAKFELLAEDDAADPKQGTAVAQKLVDSKVNGVVGHLNSAPPSRPPRSTATLAFRRSRPPPPTPSTPAKASRPRSAWWPMTCTWAARWASTR